MSNAPASKVPDVARRIVGLSAVVAVLIAAPAPGLRGEDPPKAGSSREKDGMDEISGEFDVRVVPVDTGDDKMGMMTLDKQYHGDLEATGKGRMLTGMTDVKGSAAYVAIERVAGKLKGAEGTFLVYHTGVMAAGTQSLAIRVVPDSGTGDLSGIEGEMSIEIKGGKHFYKLQYKIARPK